MIDNDSESLGDDGQDWEGDERHPTITFGRTFTHIPEHVRQDLETLERESVVYLRRPLDRGSQRFSARENRLQHRRSPTNSLVGVGHTTAVAVIRYGYSLQRHPCRPMFVSDWRWHPWSCVAHNRSYKRSGSLLNLLSQLTFIGHVRLRTKERAPDSTASSRNPAGTPTV